MGLLKSGESDENDIKESEKTNIPCFLNRLLLLEVQQQNTLFDYFYQTFNENFDLLGKMKIRRTRFQGRSVLEVCLSSFEQIRESEKSA